MRSKQIYLLLLLAMLSSRFQNRGEPYQKEAEKSWDGIYHFSNRPIQLFLLGL